MTLKTQKEDISRLLIRESYDRRLNVFHNLHFIQASKYIIDYNGQWLT